MTGAAMNNAGWAKDWLEGRVVLVTGGTGGIGGAIAEAFRDAGAEVIATGASGREVAEASARPQAAGIRHIVLDVRSTESVRAIVGGLERLDVVVNCAGIIRRGEELASEVFEQVVDINLNGSMRVCEAAAPLLEATGGTIINIASMLSFFGGGLVPGYSASKGGIAQLTKSLAIAYASDRIRVNAVAPGWIATPLTSALRGDDARSDAILARTPLGRWGQPDDIAGPVLFLCSEMASFITGTTLNIDGGYAIA